MNSSGDHRWLDVINRIDNEGAEQVQDLRVAD
jgi:hypothetical protein